MGNIQILCFLTILASANLSFGQQGFLTELGTDKAESYVKLVNSFEHFLELNYPSVEGKGERTRAFMLQLINNKEPFKFDSLDAIQIITDLDRTGLRKEIFLYEGETYEPTYEIEKFFPEIGVDIDTSEIDQNFEDPVFDEYLNSIKVELTEEQKKTNIERDRRREEDRKWRSENNPNSLYHYALLKSDTSLIAYCWLRFDGLSPAITQRLLEFPSDQLEDWRIQLPFVVDYYFASILFRYRRHMEQATNNR